MTGLHSEHQAWLERQNAKKAEQEAIENPCVRAHGPGPDGTKCKTCRHLYPKRFSKTYWKCSLRKETNGPGTDHRVNWPACSKYDELKY